MELFAILCLEYLARYLTQSYSYGDVSTPASIKQTLDCF
jgi:hypothetical protein